MHKHDRKCAERIEGNASGQTYRHTSLRYPPLLKAWTIDLQHLASTVTAFSSMTLHVSMTN